MCLGRSMNFSHEIAVAERGRGFGLGCLEVRGNSSAGQITRMPRPPPPAGFDDRREALQHRPFQGVFRTGRGSSEPGMMGIPACFMVLRAFSFSPIRRMTARVESDELQVGGFADFGEVGVFAQQAVARMDGVNVGDFGADCSVDVQVAFEERGGPMQMASSANLTFRALQSASL